MVSLGGLIEAANSDLKRALDHSKANADRASTLDTGKAQLQEKLDKLRAEQTSWAQTTENLKKRASSLNAFL